MKTRIKSIFTRSDKGSANVTNGPTEIEHIEPGATPASPNESEAAVDDTPPDGGYGWVSWNTTCPHFGEDRWLTFLPQPAGGRLRRRSIERLHMGHRRELW